MEATLERITAVRGGFAFRSDLLNHGWNDREIRAALRGGLIERLRHGTYAPKDQVSVMTPEDRHRLVARSVLHRLGDEYVLSHHSAAMFATSASFDIDLDTVHVTHRNKRNSRREAGVVFHVNAVDDQDVVIRDGIAVTAPLRAALESASISSTESGLVLVNGVLNAGGFTREEYQELAESEADWPGSRRARLVGRLADEGCESPGESRSMYLFWREGIPRPETQAEIVMSDGLVAGRSDFRWRKCRHVGEFDGMFKYGILNRGDDPAQVLVDEKLREDRIRSSGYGVTRWTWSDLAPSRRARTAARIKSDLDRSRRILVSLDGDLPARNFTG